MNKPTHIVLTDQGIGCIEAPDEPAMSNSEDKGWAEAIVTYQEALEAAIKKVVLFKDVSGWDNSALRDYIFRHHGELQKGKLYPIPENYDAKIIEDTQSEYGGDYYAVLVPKQEHGAGDDYPVIPHPHISDIDPDVKEALNKGGYWNLLGDNPKQEFKKFSLYDETPSIASANTIPKEREIKESGPSESDWNNYWINKLNREDCSRNGKRTVYKDAFIDGAKHQEGVAIKFAEWINNNCITFDKEYKKWKVPTKGFLPIEEVFGIFKHEKKMKILKFRQFNSAYADLYLFQQGRWELGFTLDITGRIDGKPDWSTWLFCIHIIFIHFEFHGK